MNVEIFITIYAVTLISYVIGGFLIAQHKIDSIK